jgi:stage II sporulation protein D
VACVAVLSLLAAPARAEVSVRVRLGERVQAVPLEAYVERAVASETYASWPTEALKAQAVVARTYALHERDRNRALAYDVESSVVSQRYQEGPVAQPIQAAVSATRGQFLSWQGQPILAVFHASAGGRTASSEEVWGRPLPYLRIVNSPDEDGPDFFWSFDIGRADLAGVLGSSELPDVVERSPSGRVLRIRVGSRELTGRELRRTLGGRALRSTRFEVRETGDVIRFVGSGSGHGVGLCQWGTRSLAESGSSYRQILSHYYPGARLEVPPLETAGNVE